MEKEEFNLLSLPPRNSKKEHLISLKIYSQSYFFIGTMMTFFCNMFFFLYLKEYTGLGFQDLVFTFGNIPEEKLKPGVTLEDFNGYYVNTGQCVCFITLVILQWGNILSVRNRRLSMFQADPFRKQRRNLWLFLGILASFLIAILVTEVPGIQEVMLTNSVPIKYWLLPLPCAVFIIIADEIRKALVRAFPKGILARIAW
jgi:sodium/potassium-transporting ATPase subunit alpha